MAASVYSVPTGPQRSGGIPADDDKAFEVALMGVMYTVCKEKARYGPAYIAFRLMIDWLQLWLLIVTPAAFDIPSDQLWWRIISFIGINQFMAIRGYTFFIVFFYLLVAGLVLSVVLSIWVGHSFKQNQFNHVWPIVTLRWFSKIFFQIFDVLSFSVLLLALDCQTFARPADQIGRIQEYPDVHCLSMPHLATAAVAIAALIVFVLLAGLFVVGEMELDFTTRNQLALMHTGVELHTFILRLMMACIATFIYDHKWASVVQLLLSSWLTYLIVWWQPQVTGWVNHVRAGSYLTIAWCSFLWLWGAFSFGTDPGSPEARSKLITQLTTTMWATTIPIGFAGYGISWLRLHWFTDTVLPKFKENADHAVQRYNFEDSRFYEVLARCCRKWVDDDHLDPQAVELGEVVLQAGLQHMPKDVFMVILHSSYLMDVRASYNSGYAELETARRLHPSFLMRFAVFSRLQQHTQRTASSSKTANGRVDLVSYVEFQRNYGLALKVHRGALTAIQYFWGCLLQQSVEFKKLALAVKQMDEAVRNAERVYKRVLLRHANSVKMVRLYAKFLEHVRQDSLLAAKWFAEADVLAAVEEQVRTATILDTTEVTNPKLADVLTKGFHANSQDNRAAIIMNAQSIMVMCNQRAAETLGYTVQEVIGKDVATILPPQIADMHPTFIRNYIATGRENIMNKEMMQVALHRDRRLVPINVTVYKLRGSGEDMLFMAIMEAIPQQPDEATIWVTPAGSIMGVCSNYEDWFGFKPKEVQGTPVARLAVKERHILEGMLKEAQQALVAATAKRRNSLDHASLRGSQPGVLDQAAEGPAPVQRKDSDDPKQTMWHGQGVSLLHKYGQPELTDICVQNAGMASLQFHVVTVMKREKPLLGRGNVSGATTSGPLSVISATGAMTFTKTKQQLPISQELMMVCTSRGNMVHVTRSMADLLDCSREQCLASPLERFIAEPFAHLHRRHMGADAHGGAGGGSHAPFSCRAGLAVLLQARPVAGRKVQLIPAHLQMQQRQEGDEVLHVIKVKEVPLEQALDERRLHLEVDAAGRVVKNYALGVSQQHLLFGFDPEVLVGRHLTEFLDVFKPKGAAPDAHMSESDIANANQAWAAMVGTAMATPGCSWRVGLLGPIENYKCNLQVKDLLIGAPKPAVLRLAVEAPEPGQDFLLNPIIHMELWKADLVTSVFDVDCSGTILEQTQEELQELYPPGLAIGASLDGMIDRRITHFVTALARHPLSDMLVPKALGPPPPGTRIVTKRSRKNNGGKKHVSGVGVPQVVSIHHNEGLNVTVTLQAVRRGGTAPGFPAFTVILHVINPQVGRSNFMTHVMRAHQASAATAAAASSVASLAPNPFRLTSAASMNLAAGSVAAHSMGGTSASGASLLDNSDAIMKSLGYTRSGGTVASQPSVTQPSAPARLMSKVEEGDEGAEQEDALDEEDEEKRAAALANDMDEDGSSTVGPLRSSVSSAASSKRDAPGLAGRSSTASRAAPVSGVAQAAQLPAREPESNRGSLEVDRASLNPHIHPATISRVRSWLTSAQDEPDQLAEGPMSPQPAIAPRSSAVAPALAVPVVPKEDDVALDVVPAAVAGELPAVASDPLRHAAAQPAAEPEAGGAQQAAPAAAADNASVQSGSFVGSEMRASDQGRDTESLQRGKRFRSFLRLLSSVAVQSPITAYRGRAYVVAAVIVALQLGAFIAIFFLVTSTRQSVNDLWRIGEAGLRATDVAVYTRTLQMLYSNLTSPTLRKVSGASDLPYVVQLYKEAIDGFKTLHKGVYLGADKPRSLPDVHGLDVIWGTKSFSVVEVASNPAQDANISLSLWDAGNALVEKAYNFWQNNEAYYQQQLSGALNMSSQPDLRWITINAPGAVFPGYLATLDAYLQVVLDNVYNLELAQLILLALEGVGFTLALTAWCWVMLARMDQRRFSMFFIFMVIPSGLVTTLATRKFRLDEDGSDDDDDDEFGEEDGAKPAGGGDPNSKVTMADPSAVGQGLSGKSYAKAGSNNSLMISSGRSLERAQQRAVGPVSRFLDKVFGLRRLTPAQVANAHLKRELVPGTLGKVWLVLPILVWGALVMIACGIGYWELVGYTGADSVAVLSAVNYAGVHYMRSALFFQEMVAERDARNMPMHRARVESAFAEFQREYSLMLYGNQRSSNDTRAHAAFLKEGSTHVGTNGPRVLYHTKSCLCLNASQCQPLGAELYTDTRTGLDRMMLRHRELGKVIQDFQFMDPALSGPEYSWIWNTLPDVRGGYEGLVDTYKAIVLNTLSLVFTLHTLALVFTVLVMASFILFFLRPFLEGTRNETRRIAELLSQLPVEVDVNAMLHRTLLLDLGVAPPPDQAGNKSQGGSSYASSSRSFDL